jgi:hypothetical protein
VIQKRGRGWGFVCGWEEPLCRGTSFSRGGSRHEGARALSSRGTTPSYGGAHPRAKAHPLPREGAVDLPLSGRPADADRPPTFASSVPGSRRAELRRSDRRWRQVSDFPRDSKSGGGGGASCAGGRSRSAEGRRSRAAARGNEGARALSSRGTTPSYGGAHPRAKAHPLPREGAVDLPLSGRPADAKCRPTFAELRALSCPTLPSSGAPTDVGAKYRTFRVIQKRGRGWGFVCGWEEPPCRGTSFSRGGSRQRRSSAPIIARNDAELRRGPPAREGPPPPSRGCRGPPPVAPPLGLRPPADRPAAAAAPPSRPTLTPSIGLST